MSKSKKIYEYPWRKHQFPRDAADLDIPDGDVEKGKELYNRSCAGCHALDENDWLGPALRDVFNRKVGSKKGFYYSTAMSMSKGNWTREKLFLFLDNPEDVVPHTAMFFDGIKDPYERSCIIEYLQYLGSMIPSKGQEKLLKKEYAKTEQVNPQGDNA